jgi:hypothetical protein
MARIAYSIYHVPDYAHTHVGQAVTLLTCAWEVLVRILTETLIIMTGDFRAIPQSYQTNAERVSLPLPLSSTFFAIHHLITTVIRFDIFQSTQFFQPNYGPGIDSASNRN